MNSDVLPPELKRFVEQEVASGRFRSEDEVIQEGLRLLQERERHVQVLREQVDAGLEQVERGEVISLGNEAEQRAFFEDVKKRGMDRLRATQDGK